MDAKLRIKIDNRLLSIDIFNVHLHMTTINDSSMKQLLCLCATLIMYITGIAQNQIHQSDVRFVAVPDHADWNYRTGENARIDLQVFAYGVPYDGAEVSYEIGPELLPADTKGTLTLKNGRATLSMGTMKKPGFRDCRFTVKHGGKQYKHQVKVAFSPEKIVPTVKMPTDFEEFWTRTKEEVIEDGKEVGYLYAAVATTDKVVRHYLVKINSSTYEHVGNVEYTAKGAGSYMANMSITSDGIILGATEKLMAIDTKEMKLLTPEEYGSDMPVYGYVSEAIDGKHYYVGIVNKDVRNLYCYDPNASADKKVTVAILSYLTSSFPHHRVGSWYRLVFCCPCGDITEAHSALNRRYFSVLCTDFLSTEALFSCRLEPFPCGLLLFLGEVHLLGRSDRKVGLRNMEQHASVLVPHKALDFIGVFFCEFEQAVSPHALPCADRPMVTITLDLKYGFVVAVCHSLTLSPHCGVVDVGYLNKLYCKSPSSIAQRKVAVGSIRPSSSAAKRRSKSWTVCPSGRNVTGESRSRRSSFCQRSG